MTIPRLDSVWTYLKSVSPMPMTWHGMIIPSGSIINVPGSPLRTALGGVHSHGERESQRHAYRRYVKAHDHRRF